MENKRIILDNNTSFKEIMDYINIPLNIGERTARANFVLTKIPYLKPAMQLYFGDLPYEYATLGEIVTDMKIVENGVKERVSFSYFIRDLHLWKDGALKSETLKSKILGLFDYTIQSDIEFIKRLVRLEQIEEFDEFGLETYNRLMGK